MDKHGVHVFPGGFPTACVRTYGRHRSEIPRSHDQAPIPIIQLQEPLRHQEDIVRFVMVVETRRVGNDSVALKDGHGAIGLGSGRKDAEDTFAAGDGEGFARELGNEVGAAVGRGGLEARDGWVGHFLFRAGFEGISAGSFFLCSFLSFSVRCDCGFGRD